MLLQDLPGVFLLASYLRSFKPRRRYTPKPVCAANLKETAPSNADCLAHYLHHIIRNMIIHYKTSLPVPHVLTTLMIDEDWADHRNAPDKYSLPVRYKNISAFEIRQPSSASVIRPMARSKISKCINAFAMPPQNKPTEVGAFWYASFESLQNPF